jgi:hypothetical protein
MSMWQIIQLGEDLQVLCAPNVFTAQSVADSRARVATSLTSLGLLPHKNIIDRLNTFTFPTPSIGSFEMIAKSLEDVVRAEAALRELAVLARSEVSTRLRVFSSSAQNLSDQQRRLAEETVRCLQVGAYRSAMVMGWNLVYDILRSWIVVDSQRLATFNTNLTVVNSGRSPIAKYEDFIFGDNPPSESDVLKACRGENGQNVILPFGIVGDFQQGLRRRNDYAHPNFNVPTFTGAHAFVEDLFRLVTNPPFADPLVFSSADDAQRTGGA